MREDGRKANAARGASPSCSGHVGTSTWVGAIARSVEGSVVHVTGGRTQSLPEGGPLWAGDRVLALQDGRVALNLPTGTRLTLESGADLMLLGDAPSQVFSLGAGSVRAEVAKLKQGERFIIRTSDAEVEVRGTSFRVAYAASDPRCGNGTTTRVSVDEGVVTVRSTGQEWTVAAHESWPRGCDATANPTSITTARPSSTPRQKRSIDREADLVDIDRVPRRGELGATLRSRATERPVRRSDDREAKR